MQTTSRVPTFAAIAPMVLALFAVATAAAAQQAVPALELETSAGAEMERSFDLRLAAAVEPGDLEPAATAGVPVQLAAVPLLEDPNAWRSTQPADASLQQNQSKGGGFGRWLKKRWYIPVLAAVVIGVTIADDDDSGEMEDD